MRIDDIRYHLHVHPFLPIRVFVSDGSHYDIYHHDFMMVGRSKIIIGISHSPNELPDQEAHVDPVHITRIEPINGHAAKGNGKSSKKSK